MWGAARFLDNEARRVRPLSRVRERVRVRGVSAAVSERSTSAADALNLPTSAPLPLILTFSRTEVGCFRLPSLSMPNSATAELGREKGSPASHLTFRGA